MLELWAMMRWAETRRLRYLVVAGAAAGIGVAIKQTGAYLVVAAVVWALYDGGVRPARRRPFDRVIRCVVGAAVLLFAAAMLR
jgi:4-amino-4-deoxy-L-arabinose transferase-like glycosyltransferase